MSARVLTVAGEAGVDGAGWARRIADAWNASRQAVIGIGALLIEAKAALPHGKFEAMVKKDLPFGPRTARRLMAITADPRIADRTHGSDLPPSMRTLYELTRLDDDQFAGAVAAGTIHADMERTDVKRILNASASAEATADQEKRRARSVASLQSLVSGGERFGGMLLDPPWSFDVYSGKGKDRSAERHYDTMDDTEIAALPVGALAADDCALFLWTTWAKLETALSVLKEWGFTYKTMGFTWIKQNPGGDGLWKGMGYWTRANPEPCLLAVRGAPKRLDEGVDELIIAPVMEHSRKPDEAHERIERLVAGPYLEMFARREYRGWTVWGDEVAPLSSEAPAKAEAG